MKKIFMLLVSVAILVFGFISNVDAKVIAHYDLTRQTVTRYVPRQTNIFTFAVVSPKTVTIHRGDLRQYIEAQCLANDEFLVLSQKDMPAIRKALNKYYIIKSHGYYNFKGDSRVKNFVRKHGLSNTLKISFIERY